MTTVHIVVETLVDLMRHSRDDRVGGTASQVLLDRGWGKAKVEVATSRRRDVYRVPATPICLESGCVRLNLYVGRYWQGLWPRNTGKVDEITLAMIR